MNRGDIYRVDSPSGDPKKSRVFVIVSRQALLDTAFSSVVCAPVYSTRRGIATEVYVGVDEGLKHASAILCDALTSMPKRAMTNYVGSLHHDKIVELRAALRVALAIEDVS